MSKVANGMRSMIAAALLVLMAAGGGFAWDGPKKKDVVVDKTVKEVLWQGETDLNMLEQVRRDLLSAREDKEIKTLRVTLISPGGPVLTSTEIARQVRIASEKGLVVEIHATALCASGCTLVLAAGTPGKRFISKETLYLVHSVQVGFGNCGTYTNEPKTEREKVVNAILDILRDLYMKFSGKDKATVEHWLTCENEQAGDGNLAVKLGLADKVE